MKASKDLFSELILLLPRFLIKSATDLRRSEENVPNEFEVKNCLQPSASKPDGPEPLLVIDAALNSISSSIASKTIGESLLLVHLKVHLLKRLYYLDVLFQVEITSLQLKVG